MAEQNQTEIRNLPCEIANAINNHAKPRKYDWIVLIVSCFSILFSAIAIAVAIFVPIRIAEQQNKISLFEKRYSIYHELKIINDFLDGYYETVSDAIDFLPIENLEELSQKQREAIYYENLWEGEIHSSYYSGSNNIGDILKQQVQIVSSLGFVFDNIDNDEENIIKSFLNTYYAMTQQYVLVNNESYYVAIHDFDKDYKRFDLTSILKKLENQLEL